jgi:hypothetical protein
MIAVSPTALLNSQRILRRIGKEGEIERRTAIIAMGMSSSSARGRSEAAHGSLA